MWDDWSSTGQMTGLYSEKKKKLFCDETGVV